jgi:cation:H+ antiporter
VAVFAPLVALVVLRSPRGERPAEPAGRPRRLALRVLAGLAGLLVGAELLVFGTGRIVREAGLSETVFGLLVVGAAVSFEEVVLEALPAFRGFPELSVGNALGTLVFLLTGSLGVIVLVRPLEVPGAVTAYHLPALAGAVALATAVLARGRLGRAEGALLVSAYAAYAAGALLR